MRRVSPFPVVFAPGAPRARDNKARTVYLAALGAPAGESHPTMRARAGDPPRTMAQKILAARSGEAALSGDSIEVQVDQIVLARSPVRAYADGLAAGLKKTRAEVAIAYDGRCMTPSDGADDVRSAAGEMLAHGLLFAKAGVGFAAPVHLERFASPARLCVTDEPRLAGVGGVGMLSLVVPTASLGRALATGRVIVRRPVSIQVLLGGRLRPFVCARDVALELLRRGLSDVVRRVEDAQSAPVIVEFGGPSARMLSVSERSVMAGLAAQVGAAACLFVSDERTEVFLRDERRSKAYRALVPDAGAPCEEVVNIDLGAVDPLLLDTNGQVRAVRDLAGKPVAQALLGGDSGVTLRDLFAAAMLLKSKRVPQRLDFLIATPSRQMLEVLAGAGALTDLIATGGRLIEPDPRVLSGELYPPPASGVALRTCDPEPRITGRGLTVVASAETVAYAVATGELGDPRAFKRPVRVTVPRALPTDDVLVARKVDRGDPPYVLRSAGLGPPAAAAWTTAQTLDLVECARLFPVDERRTGGCPAMAVVCSTLDEVREMSCRAHDLAPSVRAVLAPYIPSGLVALFSAAGIAAIRLEAAGLDEIQGQTAIALPALSHWPERKPITVVVGKAKILLTWLALGAERAWTTGAVAADGLTHPSRRKKAAQGLVA
jgi:homoaconitase/3-isopropylmalate dehydratase large subunit